MKKYEKKYIKYKSKYLILNKGGMTININIINMAGGIIL